MKATVERSSYEQQFVDVIKLLNSDFYYPYLGDLIHYVITPESYLDYKAAHCVSCVLPFCAALPICVITNAQLTTHAVKWWQLVNQTEVSSLYNAVTANPGYNTLSDLKSVLLIPDVVFDNSVPLSDKVETVLSDPRLSLSTDTVDLYSSVIRNNNRVQAVELLLRYLNYSDDVIFNVVSKVNVCLIQKCTR